VKIFAGNKRSKDDASGIVAEGVQGRLGQSWYRGPVVLSWDDVRRTAHDHNDGQNVVFHEFAHQLDSESGANEGPLMQPRTGPRKKRFIYHIEARQIQH